MKQIKGTSNKILEIDLESQSHEIYEVTARERRLFLGAKGLGLKLLFDRMTSGKDPLGPDNIIAFLPGVLMGTGGPCSGRQEKTLSLMPTWPRAIDFLAEVVWAQSWA